MESGNMNESERERKAEFRIRQQYKMAVVTLPGFLDRIGGNEWSWDDIASHVGKAADAMLAEDLRWLKLQGPADPDPTTDDPSRGIRVHQLVCQALSDERSRRVGVETEDEADARVAESHDCVVWVEQRMKRESPSTKPKRSNVKRLGEASDG